jgi:shikimate kinase
MGAGKSSVGHALSERLNWTFDDLDHHIESRQARKIADIFQEFGEQRFREIEASVLGDLLSEPASSRILALGGGTFASDDASPILRKSTLPVIFLDAPAEELFQRCQSGEFARPLLKSFDDFRNLYQQRRPGYLTATLTVNTQGKTIEAIVEEVICSLGLK